MKGKLETRNGFTHAETTIWLTVTEEEEQGLGTASRFTFQLCRLNANANGGAVMRSALSCGAP